MPIQEFVVKHKDEMRSDLVEFINIPTVLDETTVTAEHPFGAGPYKGLEWFLNKASSFGFETRNVDGYAGEITVGTGDFMIGILGHSDVVSEGEGWLTNPFQASIEDGKIIGRGSSDDKGPILSCLYGMRYLSENDLIPKGSCLRMIVGSDEEELWRCIDYYKEHVDRLPDYSIVPDGYFPMIFCEKGLFDFDMTANLAVCEDAKVIIRELRGGNGRNIVPGKAKAVLEADRKTLEDLRRIAAEEDGISTTISGSVLEIEAEGKSTHAMAPENGKSAISMLMNVLEKIGMRYSLSIGEFIHRYQKYVGDDYHAGKFGCCWEDELSGKTTLNVGIMEMKGSVVTMKANLRYPATLEKDFVQKAMAKTMSDAGFHYDEAAYLPPVYIDPESDFMKILMEVYIRDTGDTEHAPFAIGGATYARALKNSVAFGALFPYETELAHEANEYLLADSYEKMTVIYTDALKALLNMEVKHV